MTSNKNTPDTPASARGKPQDSLHTPDALISALCEIIERDGGWRREQNAADFRRTIQRFFAARSDAHDDLLAACKAAVPLMILALDQVAAEQEAA